MYHILHIAVQSEIDFWMRRVLKSSRRATYFLLLHIIWIHFLILDRIIGFKWFWIDHQMVDALRKLLGFVSESRSSVSFLEDNFQLIFLNWICFTFNQSSTFHKWTPIQIFEREEKRFLSLTQLLRPIFLFPKVSLVKYSSAFTRPAFCACRDVIRVSPFPTVFSLWPSPESRRPRWWENPVPSLQRVSPRRHLWPAASHGARIHTVAGAALCCCCCCCYERVKVRGINVHSGCMNIPPVSPHRVDLQWTLWTSRWINLLRDEKCSRMVIHSGVCFEFVHWLVDIIFKHLGVLRDWIDRRHQHISLRESDMASGKTSGTDCISRS